jgi:hypothetical protein
MKTRKTKKPPTPEKTAGQQTECPAGPKRPSKLARKLLSLGGVSVNRQAHDDPHAAELLERGREFHLPVEMRPGEPHRCHANAAGLWGHNVQGIGLVTGYGLAGDRWVQHSWAVGGGKILETTVRFERYFGVLMSDEEASWFWFSNYVRQRYPGPMGPRQDDGAAENRFTGYLVERYPGPMGLMLRIADARRKAAQAAA